MGRLRRRKGRNGHGGGRRTRQTPGVAARQHRKSRGKSNRWRLASSRTEDRVLPSPLSLHGAGGGSAAAWRPGVLAKKRQRLDKPTRQTTHRPLPARTRHAGHPRYAGFGLGSPGGRAARPGAGETRKSQRRALSPASLLDPASWGKIDAPEGLARAKMTREVGATLTGRSEGPSFLCVIFPSNSGQLAHLSGADSRQIRGSTSLRAPRASALALAASARLRRSSSDASRPFWNVLSHLLCSYQCAPANL